MWLDAPAHSLKISAQLLSSDERVRGARFRTKDAQRRFAVARSFLRAVLGQYLETEPARIEFAYTPEGKPYLPKAWARDLAFNLAHSRDLVLCAVARGPSVGVDVEYIQSLPDMDGIVQRFFSPREARQFKGVPEHDKQRTFFDAWTRKEACLKAMGRGIALGLDSIDVTFLPQEPICILTIDSDERQAVNWSLFSLTPAPNYAAAIAVSAQNGRLSHLYCLNVGDNILSHSPA